MLSKKLGHVDWYLMLATILGAWPALFVIHIIPVDFSGFYFVADSFLKYKSYAYQIIQNYCDNPINSGLNARAPFVPFLIAISMHFFGKTLLGIYLPFFIARLLLFPLIYLIGKQLLGTKGGFAATVLFAFIPKLHTFSLGAPEADIFVAVLFASAYYFYLKSNQMKSVKYVLASGIALGLAALAKSTGLGMSLGFIIAVILQRGNLIFSEQKIRRNFVILIAGFCLLIGPYLLWTLIFHGQLYITTQHDRSLWYIPNNIFTLLQTLPLYLGIDFNLGFKAKVVSAFLLLFYLAGHLIAFKRRQYLLFLPTFVIMILIATIATCVIGGDIPANYELITILGFTMIPGSLLIVLGAKACATYFWHRIFHSTLPSWMYTLLLLIILYKYINNFFTAPYSLEFTGNEYYVHFGTILSNRENLPDVQYQMTKGLRIFQGPAIHRLMRTQFYDNRSDAFSPTYKKLLLITVGSGVFLMLLDKNKKIDY